MLSYAAYFNDELEYNTACSVILSGERVGSGESNDGIVTIQLNKSVDPNVTKVLSVIAYYQDNEAYGAVYDSRNITWDTPVDEDEIDGHEDDKEWIGLTIGIVVLIIVVVVIVIIAVFVFCKKKGDYTKIIENDSKQKAMKERAKGVEEDPW